MLAARVLPLTHSQLERELSLQVPSDVVLIEDAVRLVCTHLEDRFQDTRTIYFNIRVALAEALANAMLYGNRGDRRKMVELIARYGRSVVEIHVTDEGGGFDPGAVPDPTLPENLERPDGRGVFLIRRLMDEVRFNDRGNSVCMTLRRSS